MYKISLDKETEELLKSCLKGGKTHMSYGYGLMLNSDTPQPRSNFMGRWTKEEEIENFKYNREHGFPLCMYDYPKLVQSGEIWEYFNG